jgi:cation:H+ antiporter
MLIVIALGVAGIIMLSAAADHLVLGSARLAARMRVAPVVVGILIIGFGTSAPELLVSGTAARAGHTGLAIGNLTGSNVLNLTLVLGLAGLAAPLTVRSSVVRREAPVAVGGAGMLALLLLPGLDLVAGLILSVSLVLAVTQLIRTSSVSADDPLPGEAAEFVDGVAGHGLVRESVRTVLGLAGTLIGAELLVTNAAEVAARLGVSQQVIGFTLVALGTSLPELVTSIKAQRRGESDLVVGNLLGSNLFNSLAGGAVVAFFHRGGPPTGPFSVSVLMTGVSCLAWALLARGCRLTRTESTVLILAYGLSMPLTSD